MKRKGWLAVLLVCLCMASAASAQGPIIALEAVDALLEDAPGAVVEETMPMPYSVGGWKRDAVVSFPIEVEEEGYYYVVMRYAKEGSEGPVYVRMESDATEDWVSRTMEPTGEAGDWSNYVDVYMGLLRLSQADTQLRIYADDPPDALEYVMNLESITLYNDPEMIVLHAKDAMLDDAPGAVIQTEAVQSNVGGWVSDSTVTLPVSVDAEGFYRVILRYAKEGGVQSADIVLGDASGEAGELRTAIRATTAELGDWSRYASVYLGDLYLDENTHGIAIAAENARDGADYLMNLQEICLEPHWVEAGGVVFYHLGLEDAILDDAPGVIMEPEDDPTNLGGWRPGDVVSFAVDVETEGYYAIVFRYAKDGRESWVDVRISTDDGAEEPVEATLWSTSEEPGDWSRYVDYPSYNPIYLTPDTQRITIEWIDSSVEDSHVINLRRITLMEGGY